MAKEMFVSVWTPLLRVSGRRGGPLAIGEKTRLLLNSVKAL